MKEGNTGSKGYLNWDISVWFLICSNILTIFFTIIEGWSLYTVLWIYWFQSVIIGIFHFIRILKLQKFTTKGFKINGRPASPTKKTKIFTAFFFLLHYGMFHLGYAVFLIVSPVFTFMAASFTGQSYPTTPDGFFKALIFVAISVLVFFINHLISFITNFKEDNKTEKNLGTLMFLPYARIIPMHLFVVFGLFLINSPKYIIIFLMMKTGADVIMHQVEHKVFRKQN
jgi:hypothetical protein